MGGAAVLLQITKKLSTFLQRLALFSLVFGAIGLALDNEQRRSVRLLGGIRSAPQDGNVALAAGSPATELIAFFQNQRGGVIALGQQTADAFQYDKVFRVIKIAGRAVSQDDGAWVVNSPAVTVRAIALCGGLTGGGSPR